MLTYGRADVTRMFFFPGMGRMGFGFGAMMEVLSSRSGESRKSWLEIDG